jgi:eukaryotic-like serine/threonine-protein kinase
MGETEVVARAALEAAGFSVAVTTKTTNSAPPGTVLGQSPAGSTQASPGSTVTIVVAQAPPSTKVAVPNVTGQTAGQARGTLAAAGFAVSETTQTVSTKSSDGIVLSQSPAGGSKTDKGATVTIVVGSFKQPTTPTTKTTPTPTKTTPTTGPPPRTPGR